MLAVASAPRFCARKPARSSVLPRRCGLGAPKDVENRADNQGGLLDLDLMTGMYCDDLCGQS